jgi:hypothetical protein
MDDPRPSTLTSGSQFTIEDWTAPVLAAGVTISIEKPEGLLLASESP